MARISEQQVLRYLRLADRREHIIMNSGIGWKPEYDASEQEEMDKALAELRKVIEEAKNAKRISRANGQPSKDE